ncbi:hypothetical protein BV20DRAFT_1015035 [Pilatotrama ljubarskyi]|nr:hypothetical protein BV20DRAFT_1015035 [Pilatotrama ljubarskyi]
MESGNLDLTVHYFGRTQEPGEPTPSPQALLDCAAQLVAFSCKQEKWYPPREINLSLFSLTGRGIRFSKDPPRYAASDRPGPGIPLSKEWGTSLAEEETWTLGDLEEFDHGALQALLAGDLPPAEQRLPQDRSIEGPSDGAETVDIDTPQLIRPGSKRTHHEDSALMHVSKRPRLDEQPLYGALPLPHMYPAIITLNDPWPPFTHSDLFNSSPFPIPPHTSTTAEERISDPFGRLAWIVPVRGSLPWEGATMASLNVESGDVASLEAREIMPEAPSISWTGHALRTFWAFLQELRNAGNLGPLSLAFCNPPAPNDASSPGQYSYVGSQKRNTSSLATSEGEASLLGDGSTQLPCASLGRCVYIKIYHDARYTKVLRSILNAWSYKKAGRKFRLLKGTALALLDEYGKGVLLC